MFADVRSGFRGRLVELGYATGEALGLDRVGELEGAEAATHRLAAEARTAKPEFFAPSSIEVLSGNCPIDFDTPRDLLVHLAGRPDALRDIVAIDAGREPFSDVAAALPVGTERSLRLGEALADVALGLGGRPALGSVGAATFLGGRPREYGYFAEQVGRAIGSLVRTAGLDPVALLAKVGCPQDVAAIAMGPSGDDLPGLGTMVVALVERRLDAPFVGLRTFDEETDLRAFRLAASIALVDPARPGAFEGLRELLAPPA